MQTAIPYQVTVSNAAASARWIKEFTSEDEARRDGEVFARTMQAPYEIKVKPVKTHPAPSAC